MAAVIRRVLSCLAKYRRRRTAARGEEGESKERRDSPSLHHGRVSCTYAHSMGWLELGMGWIRVEGDDDEEEEEKWVEQRKRAQF